MRYYIITADDYGMCDVVNKAIWKMFSSPDTLKYLNDRNIEVVNFDVLDE